MTPNARTADRSAAPVGGATDRLRPLFVLSLPRSGSTLLQRVLAAHSGIGTTAEPWLLLPLLYADRSEGVHAEYGHALAAVALADFTRSLPGGRAEYEAHLREFVLGLYRRAAGEGHRYFLDKSPRYCLIADDIVRLFPEGRFIFLWRNPLAILASIAETFHGGRWNLHPQKALLFDGLPRLVEAFERHRTRVLGVRYEDLVGDPEAELGRVLRYLELPEEPGLLDAFPRVQLEGRMQDPTGTRRYDRISREPLEKWKAVVRNPLRKAWARRYLAFLGAQRLSTMGYDPGVLLEELRRVPFTARGVGSDALRILHGVVYSALDGPVLKQKFRTGRPWRRVYGHF